MLYSPNPDCAEPAALHQRGLRLSVSHDRGCRSGADPVGLGAGCAIRGRHRVPLDYSQTALSLCSTSRTGSTGSRPDWSQPTLMPLSYDHRHKDRGYQASVSASHEGLDLDFVSTDDSWNLTLGISQSIVGDSFDSRLEGSRLWRSTGLSWKDDFSFSMMRRATTSSMTRTRRIQGAKRPPRMARRLQPEPHGGSGF